MRLSRIYLVLALHTVTAHANELRCGDSYLGVVAITDAELGYSSHLAAKIEEKRRVSVDRYMTENIAASIWECLSSTFQRVFSDPIGDEANLTDNRLYYFPGNNFSFGKIFTSENASSYFINSNTLSDGSVIKKVSFELDGYAQSEHIEAAIIKKVSGNWEWYKINPAGLKLRSDAECLSCHARMRSHDYLFGITDIMKIR